MDRFIGLKLDGRYEITDLIGVGGMANVYRGRDIMENRVVAVKILKNEYSENEEFVRRFRNESKAIAVLSHPNIVKIYDVGYENSMQYIVMEYIDGITLKEYIEQQGMLKWRDCVHFTIQILRALQLAHDRGIVHRDIKPQNVMLLSDGSIKVMDFGIARFSREVESTSNEKTMGSVHYVSPEQAAGARTDERSDIYSVGVMMYEMLTGRKPFNGDTPVAVALKHMHEAPVPPSQIVSSIYPGLEDIIMHAMEKDPAKRYQSASGMIRDIEAFKQDQSIIFGYSDSRSDSRQEDQGEGAKERFAAKMSAIKPHVKPRREKPQRRPAEQLPEPEEQIPEDYDDDDEVEVRHNYALPILAAATCTVIIVATLFVANVILGAFKTTASSVNDYPVPQLIGKNFYDARAQYTEIQLVATEEYNNEYPAGIIVDQEKAAGRIVKIGDTLKVTVSKGTRVVKIPDLKNYHQSSAARALEDLGLNYVFVETASDDISADNVVMTDPASGTEVEEGTTVRILVSLGPTTEDTLVPYVVGKDVVTAQYEIEDAHLKSKVQYVASSEERDMVISQNIEGGSSVPRDTVITISVSDGSGEDMDYIEDPNVPDNIYPGPNPWDDWGYNNDLGGNSQNSDINVEPGAKNVTIDIEIPSFATGTYFIFLCKEGEDESIIPPFTIDATEYAGKSYPVTISGTGTETIEGVARYGMRVKFATYTVNFDEGSYVVEEYNSSVFRALDTFIDF